LNDTLLSPISNFFCISWPKERGRENNSTAINWEQNIFFGFNSRHFLSKMQRERHDNILTCHKLGTKYFFLGLIHGTFFQKCRENDKLDTVSSALSLRVSPGKWSLQLNRSFLDKNLCQFMFTIVEYSLVYFHSAEEWK
jgi:hypothetical protein